MPYITFNGPSPTTAAQQKVATGTAIKTMLQAATPSTRQIQVLEWGFSLDAASAAVGQVELLQTDVAATVTAHSATGIVNLDPNGTTSLLTLGVSATGYTATAEGSTTAARVFDARQLSVAAGTTDLQYTRTFMPDARPIVAVSKFLRVRCTFTSTTNMTCWFVFTELG